MDESHGLAETLAAYVPGVVTRRLASDPSPILVPSATPASGVCLFLDITGFTPLTERLARQGAGGAEKMAGILNATFGPIVATCAANGGEIVDFAGDALLVFWWAEPDAMEEASLRATQCALELQTIVPAREVEDEAAVAVKISLAAGPVHVLQVGGFGGRKRSVVVGSPIEALASVAADTGSGQVVATSEVASLLGDRYDGSLTAAGNARIDALHASIPRRAIQAPSVAAVAEAALREFVPEIIPIRIGAGQDEWLAEYRRLTSVFVNLIGLRLDDSEGHDGFHETVRAIQQVVQHFGGSIHQLIDGDKGMVLLAAFGLPPNAHEDDPSRGVMAALEIEEVVSRHGLRSAIGITTGKAFTGPIGGTQRREYTVVGDVVNLAARLMQAAPDDILCDHATTRSYPEIEYEAIEPLAVKGKRDPVAAFRPHGDAPRILQRPGGDTPIVGRVTEQQTLADVLESIAGGGPGAVVVVEGEAGIGKSRLLRRMAEGADVLGIRVLAGSGSAIEEATPYLGWRSVLADALDLEGVAANTGARRRHVLRWFRSGSLPVNDASLLNDVMGLELPEAEDVSRLPDEVRAERARDLLLDIMIAAVGIEPVLIVLEDGHHLDSASWALVAAVRQRLPHAAVALGIRPAATPPAARRSDVIDTSVHLILDELAPAETVELVERSLGVARLPKAIVNMITTRTAGHPFFSQELAFALRDDGVIVIEDGMCRLDASPEELGQLTIPDTVQGVVTSRIDRLPAATQLLLKAASVIGYSFDAEVLTNIHPTGAAAASIGTQLRELEARSFISVDHGTNRIYRFTHAIIRDVAYETLPYSQRRRLHRAVAESLETRPDGDADINVALLGHHWLHAAGDGSDDDALANAERYLLQAGRIALRQGAFTEAETLLRTALSCHERRGVKVRERRQEIEILQHLSTATFATSGYGSVKTRAVTQRAYDAASGQVSGSELFPILWSLWISTHFSFATDAAVSMGQELMAIADAENDDELRMQAHHALWTTLIQVPDYRRADRHLEEGVRLYRPEWHVRHCAEFGGHDPGSCAQRALGLTLWTTGHPDQAVEAAEAAVRLAQNHAFSSTSARLALAFVHHERRDLEATEAEAKTLIDVAVEVGLPANIDWAQILLAWVDGRRGNLGPAIAEITEIKDRLGMKDPGYLAMLAELLVADGRGQESLSLIDDLLAVVNEKEHRQYEAELHRLRGEALMIDATDANAQAGAETAMRRAAAVASDQDALSFELRAHISLAGLLSGTDRADQTIRELAATLAQFDEGFSTADLQVARGLVAGS